MDQPVGNIVCAWQGCRACASVELTGNTISRLNEYWFVCDEHVEQAGLFLLTRDWGWGVDNPQIRKRRLSRARG